MTKKRKVLSLLCCIAIISSLVVLNAGLVQAITTTLDNCDSTSGWTGSNTVTLDTTNKREGTGCLTKTGSGTDWFKKTFGTAVNSGVTESNGYLHLWLYVSDITKLGASAQIEITSSGAPDTNEYNWNLKNISLVNGWNELNLQISIATKMGTPNLSAINFFRAYYFLTASITCKIDNIYFYTTGGTPTPTPTATPTPGTPTPTPTATPTPGTPTPTPTPVVGLSYNTHIFYYSWYGNPSFNGSWRHWQQGSHNPPNDIGSNFYPLLGAYDSGDYNGAVAAHMQRISDAKVGVIVYSWWGINSYEDQRALSVMNKANQYGIKVAWHIEPYGGRTAASVVNDINYINSTYGSNPAFYRDSAHGNKPAFYIFQSLNISNWSALTSVNTNNIILTQTTDCSKTQYFGGMYSYDVLAGVPAAAWQLISDYCDANGLIWAPSVGPGYEDDRAVPGNNTTDLDRSNGATYDTEWQNAINVNPDWVSITSFNEWHEGSQIEPAKYNPPGGYGYLTYVNAYGLTGAASETAYISRTNYWVGVFGR